MYKYFRLGVVSIEGNVTLPTVDIRARSMETQVGEYADLPPGIDFEPKDEPLRKDINLLGRVLGQVLLSRRARLSSTPKRRYGSCASASASTMTPR
jgi:hypothetical protein